MGDVSEAQCKLPVASLRFCCSPSSHFQEKECPEADEHMQVRTKVLMAGEDSDILEAAGAQQVGI